MPASLARLPSLSGGPGKAQFGGAQPGRPPTPGRREGATLCAPGGRGRAASKEGTRAGGGDGKGRDRSALRLRGTHWARLQAPLGAGPRGNLRRVSPRALPAAGPGAAAAGCGAPGTARCCPAGAGLRAGPCPFVSAAPEFRSNPEPP